MAKLTLTEGKTGTVVDGDVKYPEIDSCLTITCFGRGRMAGGHAVMFPEAGQKSFEEIINDISKMIPANERVRALVIGDLHNAMWVKKLPDIPTGLGVGVMSQDIAEYGKGEGGSALDVVVNTTGRWEIQTHAGVCKASSSVPLK